MATPTKVERSAEKLKESAVEIKDSAKQTERSTARIEDSADRRTGLASDRTVFAAERTYAAWVRTGLVAMASGIGARALLTGLVPEFLVITTGSVLILFSAFCYAAAVWRNLYNADPTPGAQRLPPALLISINGFLVLVALAALIGIWFGSGAPGTHPPGIL
jgi:putative membrane protein